MTEEVGQSREVSVGLRGRKTWICRRNCWKDPGERGDMTGMIGAVFSNSGCSGGEHVSLMRKCNHFAQHQPSTRAFLGVFLSTLIILYAAKYWTTQKSTTQSGVWGDTVYLAPSQRIMLLPLPLPSWIRSYPLAQVEGEKRRVPRAHCEQVCAVLFPYFNPFHSPKQPYEVGIAVRAPCYE